MNFAGVFPRPFLACLAALALALSGAVGLDALRVIRSSDAELLAAFGGAAHEDVFGLGFWFSWALLAVLEVAAVGGVYVAARTSPLRHLVPAMLVAFVVASVLSYASYSRESALWEAHMEHRR